MPEGTVIIEDGFTLTDHMPAAPGLHPAVELVYRPALARERNVYQAKLSSKDPEAIDRYENELIARQAVTANGVELRDNKDRARRLHPAIRLRLIDLILSLTPAAEAATEGNSDGA